MTHEQRFNPSSEYLSVPARLACACAAKGSSTKPNIGKHRYIGKHRSKAFFCAILFAIALPVLQGCGSYSSKGKTYPPPPSGSQALWVANGTNVLEFASASLTTTGSAAPAPSLTVNSNAFAAPQGVIFDTSANLWVIDGGNIGTGGKVTPALYEFTSSQLSGIQSGASVTPNMTINSSAFVFPQQAVGDGKGNLWVSDNGANAVFEFTAAQLTASGANVMPNITIKSTPAFNGALGIAFDSSGDLWVANNGTTTIFEFNASALPTASGSVTLTPNIMLSDDGAGSIQGPWALAFDSSGNLWSSNANSPDTIVQFSKASLAASGSPTPAVMLSSAMVSGNASLNSPNGIAFDSSGDLSVVSSLTPFGVGIYSASQLTAGGAVAPNVFIVGATTTLNAPAGSNYGPTITYGSSGGGTYGGGTW
ncbi:MAG: Vgb family protein [Acidobacteriaceae bacterium]